MPRAKNNPVLDTHPLASLPDLTVKIKWDGETRTWVTHVSELNDISTFGKTEEEALDKTSELVLGYLDSMADKHLRIPLSPAAIRRIRAALE